MYNMYYVRKNSKEWIMQTYGVDNAVKLCRHLSHMMKCRLYVTNSEGNTVAIYNGGFMMPITEE